MQMVEVQYADSTTLPCQDEGRRSNRADGVFGGQVLPVPYQEKEMKLNELAITLRIFKTAHDLDGLDLILINEVNKLGADAFVMRVLKVFDLCSQATTHTRIKKLIKKEVLAIELDGANMRTKRLVLTKKAEEILYGQNN